MNIAKLVLETGEIFQGLAPEWQEGTYFGEVVFNTGMVGYVESLTDPSYAGQILCFTYPLVGNYGVPDPSHWESKKIQVKGVLFSSLASNPSHFQSQYSLSEWLKNEKIPFMTGVDTRQLTKILRSKGVVNGAITTFDKLPTSFIDFNSTHWVDDVSIKEPTEYGDGKKKVIVVDCGIKQNILRHLKQFPIKIKHVPFNYDYTNEDYDGVFLSNGPGNPEVCDETIEILKKALKRKKPIFGICLGSQLLALAVGAKTYKLLFGHRAQNQPCISTKDHKCYLTSQNHGYAIDENSLPNDWQVNFHSLNDKTVQGIEHQSLPYFAVQFHPEANPGPTDTHWLFEKFYETL